MKSGIRKGILSDESVLKACPDQNSVPLNKLHLAVITATGKIVRPQKAAYMFNNLPNMSQAEKQSLIEDYVLRSQKAKPLVIPERVYSTLSLDKGNALVRQVATQTDGDLGTSLTNDLQGTLAAAASRQNSDPTSNEPPSTPEEDEHDRQLQHHIRRGQQHGHSARNVSGVPDPFFTQERRNPAQPSSLASPLGGLLHSRPPGMFSRGGTAQGAYEPYTPSAHTPNPPARTSNPIATIIQDTANVFRNMSPGRIGIRRRE
jgi:hypothetical protein